MRLESISIIFIECTTWQNFMLSHIRSLLIYIYIYILIFFLEKLYFTILNYTFDYTLHHKLFKCTFYTLNYDYCYTLYPNIKFTINLNGKVWHHVKIPNCSFSQSFKNKREITLYYPKLYSWLYFTP